MEVASGVFHPGFFFSTHVLLTHIKSLELKSKKFLELGAGSGLIAIYAAQNGATVTATDINPLAVKYLKKNALANNTEINVACSDLFDEIPAGKYDIVAINPPYYKKDPASFADHAWYCGADGGYFKKLFSQLEKFIYDRSKTLMIVSEDCDIEMIRRSAENNGFLMKKIITRRVNWEYLYIYEICSSVKK